MRLCWNLSEINHSRVHFHRGVTKVIREARIQQIDNRQMSLESRHPSEHNFGLMKGFLTMSDVSVTTSTQENVNLPEALQKPTRSKSLGWQLALSFANLAVWMCTIPLFQILLPNQIAALDPVNKVVLLASISFPRGITAILGNLLAGALFFPTTPRFGGRRPRVIPGALLSPFLLVLLWVSPGIFVLSLCVI